MSGGGTVRSAWFARGDAHSANRSHAHCRSGRSGKCSNNSCSWAIRCAVHAAMKSGCPTGEPSTTMPRWFGSLSPRHTSGPNSATPGGAAPAIAPIARVLPRLEAIPQPSATEWVTASRDPRQRSGTVTRYKSSRKAMRQSDGCKVSAARARDSC